MLIYLAGMIYFGRRLLPPNRKRILKLSMQKSGVVCEHIISISPAWFFEKTEVNETKVAWKTLLSIDENADYQFYFVSKANAFIVPKRAFSSMAEAQAFLNKARQYWDAAKMGQLASPDKSEIWPPPPQRAK